MLKYLAAFSCALLTVTGCKDKLNDDFQPSVADSVIVNIPEFKDTVYTAPVEASKGRRVLVEYFTGASCPGNPIADEYLTNISKANSNRVIVLGLHVFGIPQAAPVQGVGLQDFRTQEATDIMNNVYGGIIEVPVIGADRIGLHGSLAIPPNWDQAIFPRIQEDFTQVNIHLSSTYDESTGKALIKVTLAYIHDVSFSHSLSLALVEDSLVDAQEYPGGIKTAYVFNNVVRDYITSYKGLEVLPDSATKTAGTVYEAQFYCPVNTAWKPKNCRLVAYVHRNDETYKEVIQTVVAPLSQ